MRLTNRITNLSLVAALGAATALTAAPASADRVQFQGPKHKQIRMEVPTETRSIYEVARARLNPRQIRVRLRRQGYRRITALQYVGGFRDYYRAHAWVGNRQYTLRVSDDTGRVTERTLVNRGRPNSRRGHRGRNYGRGARLGERGVRRQLRAYGYRRISNIRYVDRGRRDFYVARAWRRGHMYRVRVSDENGRVIGARRIR